MTFPRKLWTRQNGFGCLLRHDPHAFSYHMGLKGSWRCLSAFHAELLISFVVDNALYISIFRSKLCLLLQIQFSFFQIIFILHSFMLISLLKCSNYRNCLFLYKHFENIMVDMASLDQVNIYLLINYFTRYDLILQALLILKKANKFTCILKFEERLHMHLSTLWTNPILGMKYETS